MANRGLLDAFTGMIVDGLALEQDVAAGSVACGRCGDGLLSGAAVTVSLLNYDNHTWEPAGVYCADHGVEGVAATMGVRAVDQAVVGAHLEETGYRSPDGQFHPNAVTLGGVEILDFSPTADGY